MAWSFVIGIMHLFVFNRFIESFRNPIISNILISLFIISIGAFGFVTFHNWIEKADVSMYFTLAMITYFVPQLFMLSFERYILIPPPFYFEWTYNEDHEVPQFNPDDVVILTINLPTNLDATLHKQMKLKTPPYFTFGDFFHFFVSQYNQTYYQEQIEYKNANDVPYGWQFYIKSNSILGQKITIDPRKTIKENKINQNQIITIERIIK